MTFTNKSITYKEQTFRIVLFILFTVAIASMGIYANDTTIVISNLIVVIFLGFFFFYQLLYDVKSYHINLVWVSYALFFIFSIASIFWTIEPQNTLFTLKRIFMILVIGLVIYNILKIYQMYDALYIGMMIGGFYNFYLALTSLGEYHAGERFSGAFELPTALGTYMMLAIMAAVLFLQKRRVFWLRWVSYLFIATSFFVIVLSISRASMVLSFVVILLFFYQSIKDKKVRRDIYILLFLIAVGLIYFVDFKDIVEYYNKIVDRVLGLIGATGSGYRDDSTTERMRLAKLAFEVYASHPFLGTGLDSLRGHLIADLHSHNTFLELLGGVGPLGMILYFLLYYYLIKKIIAMPHSWLRTYLLLFTILLLIRNLTGITYNNKLYIFYAFLFSALAEDSTKKIVVKQ